MDPKEAGTILEARASLMSRSKTFPESRGSSGERDLRAYESMPARIIHSSPSSSSSRWGFFAVFRDALQPLLAFRFPFHSNYFSKPRRRQGWMEQNLVHAESEHDHALPAMHSMQSAGSSSLTSSSAGRVWISLSRTSKIHPLETVSGLTSNTSAHTSCSQRNSPGLVKTHAWLPPLPQSPCVESPKPPKTWSSAPALESQTPLRQKNQEMAVKKDQFGAADLQQDTSMQQSHRFDPWSMQDGVGDVSTSFSVPAHVISPPQVGAISTHNLIRLMQ
jgi:hypothetical protein